MLGPSGGTTPLFAQMVIPIATDYRASDWLLAQTEVQQLLLKSSSTPLPRCPSTRYAHLPHPLSLMERFKGETTEEGTPKVLDWLHFHGRRLEERFNLAAYRTMTFLTSNIGVAKNAQELAHIRSNIHLVRVSIRTSSSPRTHPPHTPRAYGTRATQPPLHH